MSYNASRNFSITLRVFMDEICVQDHFYLLGDKRTIIRFVVLLRGAKLQSLSGYYLDEY